MNKQFLIVINDGPYSSERSCNALRLALGLADQPDTDVKVFLFGDGTQCALKGQDSTQVHNIENMVGSIAKRGAVST